MKLKIKVLLVVGVTAFAAAVFIIGTQSYFNHKEIRVASEGCYDTGGLPKVESDFLALNYSFSCEENN